MGVLFVDAKGEPSCLFRVVVTRRGWCGSGIDAAIVAQHEVCIRATDAEDRVWTDRFRVQPTLAGLRSLSSRLAEVPGVVAVVEPTSMTWLALSVALRDAGCDLSLLGAGMRPGCAGRSAVSTRVM
jgi:hypothetical protein